MIRVASPSVKRARAPFERCHTLLGTSGSARARPGAASAPSKSLSWRPGSTSIRASLGRIATLAGCQGDLANNSPETRHARPPREGPGSTRWLNGTIFAVATAQESFKQMLRDHVAPALREMGFRGSGQNFSLRSDSHWALLDFQKSQWSSEDKIAFTVNLPVV